MLNLRIEDVRNYVHSVSLRELEGFGVEPIGDPHYIYGHNNNHEQNAHHAGEQDANDTVEQDGNDGADFILYDDNGIYVDEDDHDVELASTVVETADSNSHSDKTQNGETQTPVQSVEFDDPQNTGDAETHGDKIKTTEIEVPAQPAEPNGPPGHDELQSLVNAAVLASTPPNSPSWADETEAAEAAGLLPSSSSSDETISDHASMAEASSNSDEAPLSENLLTLLRAIGANTDVTRDWIPITPTTDYYLKHNEYWRRAVEYGWKPLEKEEYQESEAETAILDAWDEENDMYYWQREGLFLCLLAELVKKPEFYEAGEFFRIVRRRPT
ncbi:hypothetical protein F4808DRAFT_473560 [Astrocystis sublimbata]|nr:hypothetical protein F4808DRAFT_473560 [Astrocystis sublimbata]